MSAKKRVTIYDIANRLNLTASSVSRALNNKPAVNENTRQLILRTAAEMNYKQNVVASNLRKGKSQTIGIVVPQINQNFFANVIAGIETIAYQQGYNLIICQSNELQEKEIQCINMLINQQVDCIFISISADGNDYPHLQNVLDHHIPLVQFDRVLDGLETYKVINDNERASREAVTDMIKQGYRRIALLEGPQNLNVFRHRKNGYLTALKNHGLPIIHELILPNAADKDENKKAIRRLLSLQNPPDAIFASQDDFSALSILETATDMNIKVPSELGICGYSNENFTSITSPSITTIDQFSVEIGRTVAQTFFQEFVNKKGPVDVVSKTISIKPRLIVRSSTKKNEWPFEREIFETLN